MLNKLKSLTLTGLSPITGNNSHSNNNEDNSEIKALMMRLIASETLKYNKLYELGQITKQDIEKQLLSIDEEISLLDDKIFDSNAKNSTNRQLELYLASSVSQDQIHDYNGTIDSSTDSIRSNNNHSNQFSSDIDPPFSRISSNANTPLSVSRDNRSSIGRRQQLSNYYRRLSTPKTESSDSNDLSTYRQYSSPRPTSVHKNISSTTRARYRNSVTPNSSSRAGDGINISESLSSNPRSNHKTNFAVDELSVLDQLTMQSNQLNSSALKDLSLTVNVSDNSVIDNTMVRMRSDSQLSQNSQRSVSTYTSTVSTLSSDDNSIPQPNEPSSNVDPNNSNSASIWNKMSSYSHQSSPFVEEYQPVSKKSSGVLEFSIIEGDFTGLIDDYSTTITSTVPGILTWSFPKKKSSLSIQGISNFCFPS